MTATTSADSFCLQIRQILASRLGPQRYEMWFDRSAMLDYLGDDRCLLVTAPNRFACDWIQRHFQNELTQAAQQVIGSGVSLRFQMVSPAGATSGSGSSDSQGPLNPSVQSPVIPSASGHAAALDGHAQVAEQINHHQTQRYVKAAASGLAIRYRLDDFIVGSHNELAFVAAQQLVAHPLTNHSRSSGAHLAVSPSSHAAGGDWGGNLGGGVLANGCREGTVLGGGGIGGVFVHGGVGLGKTHLLQGICRRMLESHPDAQVLYTTGEQFTNEFVWAVKQNQIEAFRRKMRRLDLLAVDDVHFIANKTATQQEFLHCFNSMELTGARVVLASDCHPKLIQQFSQALVSRCLQGMVVEVKAPDVQTRMKILHALASRRGMMLSDSAASAMAHQSHGSIREMEGSLTKLQALSLLNPDLTSASSVAVPGRTIDGGLVHRLFSLEAHASPVRPVAISQIIAVVCDRLNIGRDRIMRTCRRKETVLARALVVYLARTLTSMSYPEIALAIGRSSHSTVITADQRIRQMLSGSDKATVELAGHDGLPEQVGLGLLIQELTSHLRPPSPPLK